MIDEREVFDRFHEALDVEPQPGAFDRLQATLTRRPLKRSPRTRFVLPVPRIGLRLGAAGLVALLLTLAIAGTFLALRLSASHNAPAKPSRTILLGQLHGGEPQMVTPTIGWSFLSQFPPTFRRTTDGGATWRSVKPSQLGPNADVRAWYFLDADHAWIGAVVSGTYLTVFATADGGTTWTAGGSVPSGFETFNGRPLGGAGGSKLDFLDDRVGWLRTSSDPGPHDLKLYGTSDGGRTWHLIVAAADSDGSILGTLGRGCLESDLRFVSVNLGWISYDCITPQQNAAVAGGQPAGQAGSGYPAPGPRVAMTKDGGRTWQQVLLPRITTDQNLCDTSAPIFYNGSHQVLFTVCFNPSQVGACASSPDLCGAYFGIFVSSDAGLSWSLRPTPPSGGAVFDDAESGWSMRWLGEKGGIDMLRTSDGGLTWKLAGSFPASSPGFMQVFDSNVAIVTTVDTSGVMTNWKTSDGGRTWVVIASSPSS